MQENPFLVFLHFGCARQSLLPTTVHLPSVLVATAVGMLALSYSKAFPVCSNVESWVLRNAHSTRERVQVDVYKFIYRIK